MSVDLEFFFHEFCIEKGAKVWRSNACLNFNEIMIHTFSDFLKLEFRVLVLSSYI